MSQRFRNKENTKVNEQPKSSDLASKYHQKRPRSPWRAGKVPDDPGTSFRPESEVLKEA